MRCRPLIPPVIAFVALACERGPTAPEAAGAGGATELAVGAALTEGSVTGGGTITFGSSTEHISVNVVGNSGFAVFHNRAAGGNFSGRLEIECVDIVGNIATLSGVVTQSNNPELVGSEFIFRIVDNGEGAGGPDLMSLLTASAFPAEEACHIFHELDLEDVKGNFRVEPAD